MYRCADESCGWKGTEPLRNLIGQDNEDCPVCGGSVIKIPPEPGTAEYQALVEARGQKRLFGEDLLD